MPAQFTPDGIGAHGSAAISRRFGLRDRDHIGGIIIRDIDLQHEIDIRRGAPAVTGRFCVIGAKIKEDALKELFNLG